MFKISRLAQLITYLAPFAREEGNSGKQGLQRLLLLRSFITVISIAVWLVFQSSLGLEFSLILSAALLFFMALSVTIGYWRTKTSDLISNIELFCHLLFDVAVLIIVLLNSGGVSNPLISYLLVLLAVTATLLPRNFVIVFASMGILIYTSFLFIDLQSGHNMIGGPEEQELVFQLHLVGMWVIFLVSSILIGVFITHMANAIKDRDGLFQLRFLHPS
mgnify:FL=1